MRIIRGKYGRRRFDVPTNISARPTTDFARENIFNVLENLIDFEGKTALDLFAGTGAITFELLSRGCAEVTAVEKAATQYNFIRKVAQQLNVSNLRLIKGDVFRFLDSRRRTLRLHIRRPALRHARLCRRSRQDTRQQVVEARHTGGGGALAQPRLLAAARLFRAPSVRLGKFSLFRVGE